MGKSARERLDAFRGDLTRELRDHASVTLEAVRGWRIVDVEPHERGNRSLTWFESATDGPGSLVLQLGDLGGRWELDVTHEDVQFLEDVAGSVIAGRAEETFGPGRSCMTVTLHDGEVVRQEGGGLLSLMPAPGWRRRGRTVTYAPCAPPAKSSEKPRTS